MKKIILLTIVCMFLLTVVSALDETYVGQQCISINLLETCSVDGLPCDNSFTCNITIINPNQVVSVLNKAMTRNDTVYNYTFTDTCPLGIYSAPVYCTNGTLSGDNEDGEFRITTTGKVTNVKMLIFLLISAFLLFILALYLKNNAVGFIAGILFVMSGVYLMIYGFGDIADLYTRSLALVAIAFGSFISIVAGLEWLEDLDDYA